MWRKINEESKSQKMILIFEIILCILVQIIYADITFYQVQLMEILKQRKWAMEIIWINTLR
ncbi:MAG: hypothetical protein PWQ25_2227 [Deferribacteres bacterium]|mgnify:CR=1|nr:hypothetical protein [Deferribacteres bacterium]